MTLTSATIARLTGDPDRTVRYRLQRWHERGGPVTRTARPGGGWQYCVALEDYAARVGREVDELRAELAEHQVPVARGVDPRGRPPRACPFALRPFGAAAGGGFPLDTP